MHNAKSNRRWSAHLAYHWWKYLILTVASVMLWTSVFDTLAKPARNEKVGIVFFGDKLDVKGLHADLSGAVDDLTEQTITTVDVSQTIADSEQLGQILMARSYDCDLLILSASYVDQLAAYGFFMPLPEDTWEYPTYTQEKDGMPVAYGLEIYRPGSQNHFSSFCSGSETYYVFLSKESVNLAGLNGNGNEADDAALRILEYLLEEPNGSHKETQKGF